MPLLPSRPAPPRPLPKPCPCVPCSRPPEPPCAPSAPSLASLCPAGPSARLRPSQGPLRQDAQAKAYVGPVCAGQGPLWPRGLTGHGEARSVHVVGQGGRKAKGPAQGASRPGSARRGSHRAPDQQGRKALDSRAPGLLGSGSTTETPSGASSKGAGPRGPGRPWPKAPVTQATRPGVDS
jgi:hypothetical protein